eukprot:1138506-Pelagomonas_calceolata.AAC.8
MDIAIQKEGKKGQGISIWMHAKKKLPFSKSTHKVTNHAPCPAPPAGGYGAGTWRQTGAEGTLRPEPGPGRHLHVDLYSSVWVLRC